MFDCRKIRKMKGKHYSRDYCLLGDKKRIIIILGFFKFVGDQGLLIFELILMNNKLILTTFIIKFLT